MTRLEERGVHCGACTTGACCTFTANSMRITPLEAIDLLQHLGEVDAALRARLAASIERFALDKAPAGDGRRTFGRKRYTCPFFGDKALGCPLPRAAKPYGCLAFNARSSGVRDGEDCGSDAELLGRRDTAEEDALNAAARAAFDIAWDKETIPVALLALAEEAAWRG